MVADRSNRLITDWMLNVQVFKTRNKKCGEWFSTKGWLILCFEKLNFQRIFVNAYANLNLYFFTFDFFTFIFKSYLNVNSSVSDRERKDIPRIKLD